MCSDIILIGPIGVGKSTMATLLARKLRVSSVSLDKVRFKYYRHIGYDQCVAEAIPIWASTDPMPDAIACRMTASDST